MAESRPVTSIANDNSKLVKEIYDKYNIDIAILEQANITANKNNKSLIYSLLNDSNLPAKVVSELTINMYGLDFIDLPEIDINEIPSRYTNNELLEKYNAVPIFEKNGTLYIAINDPNDYVSLNTYQFQTGVNTQSILMSSKNIEKIKKIINSKLLNKDLNTLNFNANTTRNNKESTTTENNLDADNNPVVEYVNKIINEAIKKDASDIHFEPYKDCYRIRFRNDGVLIEIAKLPIEHLNKINSRVKVISNLDISEKRMPQDGRFNLNIDNKNYDFRVSTCPTLFGEKIVIRILDPYKAKLGIDELGYEDDQKHVFLKALEKLQGIILVTGPTGSGKTISLYTALNILNTDFRNISTAEDPIEIYLEGINQVQVNNKIGLTFASALRCFLRQDPDVMMVGEIRDLETAEIAIKAAQTGHLVLSTLHTNSAAETLNRLINMGLPTYNLATTISLVIAQRLIRKLCNYCKIEDHLSIEILKNENFPKELITEDTAIYTSNQKGCDKCNHGYKGRIGIYETMFISKEMEKIILNNGSALDIKQQACKEGILSLRQAGLRKVIRGITSLTEVNRVTKNS